MRVSFDFMFSSFPEKNFRKRRHLQFRHVCTIDEMVEYVDGKENSEATDTA